MVKFTGFAAVVISSLLSACSVSVKPAVAPTNPPQITKKAFEANQLQGAYRADAPQVFLWPESIGDQATGEIRPMTYDEKVESRRRIVEAAETLSFVRPRLASLVAEIEEKYAAQKKVIEEEFLSLGCYRFCDEFWGCDPNEPAVEVDFWRDPENDEEAEEIKVCQANQDRRVGPNNEIDQAKQQEMASNQELKNLQTQASLAGQTFFGEIGSNYFTGFTGFRFERIEGVLTISLELDGHSYSSHDSNSLPIENVNLDLINGYMTFEIDYLGSDLFRPGRMSFDLELTFFGPILSIGGSIVLSHQGLSPRSGRFASSGQLVL